MPTTIKSSKKTENTSKDGFVAVRIPSGLIQLVDNLVNKNMFSSRAQGCVALITAGLKDFK